MIRLIPVALLLTLIVPPATTLAFSASSMAAGLLLCAVLWSLLGLTRGTPPFTLEKADAYRVAALLLVIVLLMGHLFVSGYRVNGIDVTRFYSSCLVLAAFCIGTHFAAGLLLRTPSVNLIHAADLVLGSLFLVALAAIAGVPAIGSQSYGRPVVLFSEPSHFALAFLPMLMFRVSVSRRSTQVVLIGLSLVLAAALQSLTMVAGILLISALLLRRLPLLLMSCVVAGAVAVAVAVAAIDPSYYLERLTFSSDTTNFSTLVFMQGWEQAILNFTDTQGIGVGFQQFGIAGPIGDIAYRVSDLLGGSYLNLRDGGSTAAKLIGEFGVLGAAVLLVYVIVAFRSLGTMRAAQSNAAPNRDVRALFFHSLIVSYSFELFIRGLGYFSPGSFLTIAALLAIYRSRIPQSLIAYEHAKRSA